MNRKSKLLALLGAALCSFSAQAALWNFSYTFPDYDGGDSYPRVIGSFTGDEDGPYIRNLGNVSMTFEIRNFSHQLWYSESMPNDGSVVVESNPNFGRGVFNPETQEWEWVIYPPVASMDLALNNFRFMNYAGGRVFQMYNVEGSFDGAEVWWGGATQVEYPGLPEHWILTRADVAEPGSLALLAMGLAVMGVGSRRRSED